MRCSRAEQQEWPITIPAHGRETVRLNLHAVEPGPIDIELAFWSAEGRVLQNVPFQIKGEAR